MNEFFSWFITFLLVIGTICLVPLGIVQAISIIIEYRKYSENKTISDRLYLFSIFSLGLFISYLLIVALIIKIRFTPTPIGYTKKQLNQEAYTNATILLYLLLGFSIYIISLGILALQDLPNQIDNKLVRKLSIINISLGLLFLLSTIITIYKK